MLAMRWQHTQDSALLGFVQDDAAFVASQVARHARAA
jgi:hypothetical protein